MSHSKLLFKHTALDTQAIYLLQHIPAVCRLGNFIRPTTPVCKLETFIKSKTHIFFLYADGERL